MAEAPEESAIDLQWLAPGYCAAPAEALERIRILCAMHSDLFGAVWAVMATHQGLPREILAMAIKKFRADAEKLTQEDLVSMMSASVNGGRQGFDAVRRTRNRATRTASALPWATG